VHESENHYMRKMYGNPRTHVTMGLVLSRSGHGKDVNIIQYDRVLYSRDHQGLGVAHEKISPKNQRHFSHTMMWQYWLGKTKPNKCLQIDLKRFQQVATEF